MTRASASQQAPTGGARDGDEGRIVCAGCRQELSRDDAERIVWHERVGVVYDMRGGAPGEEVFIHPHPECVGAACWGGFGRMLGREIDRPDREEFIEEVRDGLRRRLLERLGDAGRSRDAGAGASRVDEMVSANDAEIILLAEDAGEEARHVASRADREEVPVIELLDAEAFGEPIGKEGIDIWAVSDTDRAEACGLDAEKIVSMQSPLDNG